MRDEKKIAGRSIVHRGASYLIASSRAFGQAAFRPIFRWESHLKTPIVLIDSLCTRSCLNMNGKRVLC